MARLYRLIVAFVIAAFSASAFAVITPVVSYRDVLGRVDTVGGLVAWWQAYDPTLNCLSPYTPKPATWEARNVTASKFDLYKVASNCLGTGTVNTLSQSPTAVGTSCPTGSAMSGSTCECVAPLVDINGQCKPPACPTGQHEEGGACVPDACQPDETRVNGVCVKPPPCPAGQTRVNGVCKPNGCEPGKAVGDRTTDGDNTTYTCEGGCSVRTNPAVCVRLEGVLECVGTGRLTGSTCTPGDGGGTGSGGTGSGGTGDGGTGNGGTGDGGTGGTGTGGTGTGGTGGTGTGGTGGTGTGGTGTGGTGTGGTGTGGTGTGDTGTGGTGTGGTGPSTGTGGPTLPPPDPKPQNPDGTCPTGFHKSGTWCIKDPSPPDGDGKCPDGTVKIGDKCVSTEPSGGGTGGGNGDGDGDKSGFGGSCMSGFACEGDAIQCAIAKEQYRRNCQMFEDKSPESELYEAEKKKDRNRDVTKDLPGNEEVDVSGRLSRLNVLGAAACIGDLSVTVWHTQVTLPFSRLCTALEQLGWILVVVSSIAAARIITKT